MLVKSGVYNGRRAYVVDVLRTTPTRVVVQCPLDLNGIEVPFAIRTGKRIGDGDYYPDRLLVGKEAVERLAAYERDQRREKLHESFYGLAQFARSASNSIEAIESKAREVYHELGLDRVDSCQKADNRRDVLRIPPVVSAAIWDRLQEMQEELDQAMSENNTDAD